MNFHAETKEISMPNVQIMERDDAPRSLAPITPMDMLDRAVSQGANIDTLTKLMDLQERWEANQARKAFDAAMAAAKAEIPVILKNRTVDFTGKTGVRTHYQHEDLAEIARTVDPILAKHGLSYRYRTESPIGAPVTVTCVVSHRDGHSEENTLCGPRDESGNKNPIQSVGSTITFLQRYTLKSSLGLAAAVDDDGHLSDASTDTTASISEAQRKELQALIENADADVVAFCQWARVDSVAEIPASMFGKAKQALEAKVRQNGAAK